jgi:hypothetical protein
MYKLSHYLSHTIRQFFHDKYVRIEMLKLVKSATASISVSWANITGSISDNADLQDALDAKADTTALADYSTIAATNTAIANATNQKAAITALTALDPAADLPTAVAAINDIIAALQA